MISWISVIYILEILDLSVSLHLFHIYLNIYMPFGGQIYYFPVNFFITIDVLSPGLTTIEKGSYIFLNWFLNLYPDYFTNLKNIINKLLRIDLNKHPIFTLFLDPNSNKPMPNFLE